MKNNINFNRICMYCGQNKKEYWDEYTKYYECDCIDAIKDREIDEKIAELERSRPKNKYQIGSCLEKI